MRNERCETCRFWVYSGPVLEAAVGRCHRYPPIFLYDRAGHQPAHAADWCGEWQGFETPEDRQTERILAEARALSR